MQKVKWDNEPLLGKVTDAELAKKHGVTAGSVGRARHVRNIPQYNPALASNTRDTYQDELNPAPHPRAPRPADPNGPRSGGFSFRELAEFLRQPRTLDELCDAMDCGPTRARESVEEAKKAGVPINLQGGRLLWQVPEESAGDEAKVSVAQPVGGWHQVAIVGDVHFGSKYCRDDYLLDFCEKAHARGIRTFLQVGDMLDGEYRHGIRELRAHGFDEQADECIELLPEMPGAHWYFIDGNHDETFTHSAGIVSGRALVDRAVSKGRADLTYLGQRKGLVRLDVGAPYQPLIELWHPKKGPAYAESYHLQKRCEAYMPGGKPDILLAGHWHQFAYIVSRGIHAVSCGTFQGGGSAYSNAIGTGQAIGATILSFSLTEHGTLRQVAVERVNYYEREEARVVRAQ